MPLIAVSTGTIQGAVAIADGCLVIIGGVIMALSLQVKQERLFWCTGGLVQLTGGGSGPLVVRWDDVATISVTYDSRDVAPRAEQVVICGRTENCVTIDDKYGLNFVRELAAEAESILAARVVPELIETYESGKPVVFADMTINQWGIICDGASSGVAWRTPWEDMRRIGIDGPGHGLRIQTSRRTGGKWINLDGCPNGIVAHHLIQHAVARIGVPIHHIDRLRGSGVRKSLPPGHDEGTVDDLA